MSPHYKTVFILTGDYSGGGKERWGEAQGCEIVCVRACVRVRICACFKYSALSLTHVPLRDWAH